jgi:4-hydroxy-tetrahydrodipicolinate reductase
MSTAIGVTGACGRMGQAIIALLAAREDAHLSAALEHGEHERLGETISGVMLGSDLAAFAAAGDVLIDFSSPAALRRHVDAAVTAGKPLVVGTTGLEASHLAVLKEAAHNIAVLQAANMSLGVNLLAMLVEQVSARLDQGWDIEIVEMHHRHKVDAPSGTALMLGRHAARGRQVALAEMSVRSRDGITGTRRAGSIGFATLRGGSVAGDHQVIFASDGERLELGHRAESREIFARGAIEAALWLRQQPAGLYAMRDMLGDLNAAS